MQRDLAARDMQKMLPGSIYLKRSLAARAAWSWRRMAGGTGVPTVKTVGVLVTSISGADASCASR